MAFLVLYTLQKGVVEPINTAVSKVKSIIHTKSEAGASEESLNNLYAENIEPYNLEFKYDKDLDIEVFTTGETYSS